jgi:hypothetical protein
MATSNLKKITLGGVEMSSGQGSPNHTAKKGSLYFNESTNTLFQNGDGNLQWAPLIKSIYGEIGINTNTTVTSIATINVWVLLSALSWSTFGVETVKGFIRNGSKLVLNNGLGGLYRVIASATILRSATGEFEIGISKNGVNPTVGFISGTGVNTTHTSGNCVITNDIRLSGGDSIELSARCIDSSTNLIIRNASIVVYRIGD